MENMQNMNEEKSRKKLLVPLVVLLLCAVSLTGAAYAYTSSLTYKDNTTAVEFLSVDKEGTTLVNLTDKTILGFTDNFTYEDNSANVAEKIENVIKYALKDGIVVATYHIKINNEKDTVKDVDLTVSSAALKDSVLFIKDSTPVKLKDVFDVTYTVKAGDTVVASDKKVIIPAGTDISSSAADYTASVKTETALDIVIKFTLNSTYSGSTEGEVETVTEFNGEEHDAAYWYGQFMNGSNNKFDLVFKAAIIEE